MAYPATRGIDLHRVRTRVSLIRWNHREDRLRLPLCDRDRIGSEVGCRVLWITTEREVNLSFKCFKGCQLQLILSRLPDRYLLDLRVCRNRKIFTRDEGEALLGMDPLAQDALMNGIDPLWKIGIGWPVCKETCRDHCFNRWDILSGCKDLNVGVVFS